MTDGPQNHENPGEKGQDKGASPGGPCPICGAGLFRAKCLKYGSGVIRYEYKTKCLKCDHERKVDEDG